METLTTFESALARAAPFVAGMSRPLHHAPFELSPRALRNTLTYVFSYLHHSCYLLLVKDTHRELVKIENSAPSPIYARALARAVTRLDSNTTITDSQRAWIRRFVKTTRAVRVMQCIAKRFPPADHVLDKRNEYETLLAPLKIPDGVFVLNLTDAVILRADGMHPFPNVVGVLPLGAHNYAQHLPIFSLSGQHGYLDICIPNYDDVQFALGVRGARELQMDRFVTVWARKRHARAVFRGGPTGCGYTPETNARIRVAMMDSPMLDAGITMLLPSTRTIDSLSLRFDPKHGLGMLNTGLRPAARLEMWQQSEYKYMLHIDGNVSAYRLLVSLATGSLILRVTSAYTSWLDDYIEAGVHYVAVSAGADDLLDVLAWCKTHDAACRKISRAGLAVARDMLDRTRIEREFERIFAEAVSKREEGEEHISSPIFALDDLAPAPRRDGARCPDGFARTLVARERVCARKTRRKVHGA